MKAIYELKRIKDSTDSNLTRALSIYSKNIEPILRTDTREIMYWLDNYGKHYKDKFYLLGLYLNNKLIGYAQLVYFENECILFVDYIVIDKDFRRNNTFYQFIEEIKNFLIDEEVVYDYILGEVGYFNDKKIPTESTRNLIRLLKMSGFGVIKTNYYQPMLGKNNYESELMSVLMIYTPNDLKKIKKDTFQLMINTIYFKHYKRWYDKFLNEFEQANYVLGLNKLMTLMNESIKRKDFIEINGYSHIYNSEPLPKESKFASKLLNITGLLVLFSIVATLIGIGVIKLKNIYHIDSTGLVFICISSIALLMFLFHVFYKNKNQPISWIIEKMIGIFK